MSALTENTEKIRSLIEQANNLPDATKPAPEEKDVNFFDYDGTLLYSYTLEEVQTMTTLPPAPTPKKDFLEFQEWNWTLDQIKTFGKIADVGATYKTKDGKTHLVVDIWDDVEKTVNLTIKAWGAGATINWGDGATSPVGTGVQAVTHQYNSLGSYTISISMEDGGWNIDLGDASSLNVMGGASIQYNTNLTEAYLGEKTRLTPHAFRSCVRLENVTVPKDKTDAIWANAFSNCRNLLGCVIPSQIKTIHGSVFQNCGSLKAICLHNGVSSVGYASLAASGIGRVVFPQNAELSGETTSGCYLLKTVVDPDPIARIQNMMFYQAFSMREYTVKETVTSIGASAFFNTLGMKKIKFLPVVPPTVENANAFANVPTACVVEVPAESLADYQAATNYSNIVNNMVGV